MATAATSGVWPSVSANLPDLKGLNTDHIRWGVPAGVGGGQSGYRFADGTVAMEVDGNEFTLGTFTHENFVVKGFSPMQFQVVLEVSITFDEGDLTREFSFTFHHNETPNVEGPIPDEVDLPTLQSPETVIIDGSEYAVLIRGFKQGVRSSPSSSVPRTAQTAQTSSPNWPWSASPTSSSQTSASRARSSARRPTNTSRSSIVALLRPTSPPGCWAPTTQAKISDSPLGPCWSRDGRSGSTPTRCMLRQAVSRTASSDPSGTTRVTSPSFVTPVAGWYLSSATAPKNCPNLDSTQGQAGAIISSGYFRAPEEMTSVPV